MELFCFSLNISIYFTKKIAKYNFNSVNAWTFELSVIQETDLEVTEPWKTTSKSAYFFISKSRTCPSYICI